MCLCGDVLYIQIKKWYVKFGATGSLSRILKVTKVMINFSVIHSYDLLF